ncbi:MAG: phage tail sheath family protein [Blastocatellia bacterium]|nr:MAG: phage tail sheath family protein [Blastocatellia bacterium]
MQPTTVRFEADPRYPAPGLYFEELARTDGGRFRTGQPAFLGLPPTGGPSDLDRGVLVHWLSDWEQFGQRVGRPPARTFLARAVRGFFENGGKRCAVVSSRLDSSRGEDSAGIAQPNRWREFVARSLAKLELIEDIDLVCAPDLPDVDNLRLDLQEKLLAHCDSMQDRFAILDSAAAATPSDAAALWHELVSANGALYFPWIRTADAPGGADWVPPCGHIAGVYARTDTRVGVHKAPANEVIEGAVDIRVQVTDAEQSRLNGVGVNCVRMLPGRGIRVWGARTLSGRAEWRYVNVRRLFITLRRWLDSECQDLVFEGNDLQLWDRVRDRLNNYCYTLFQRGALKGSTPEEAYYVKCDAETNPPARREAGEVTIEIGLAPTRPAEFVVVRITQSATGGTTAETSLTTDRS